MDFIENHKLNKSNISLTNVKDEYEYRLIQSMRVLTLAIVLTALLVFLELSLIALIIKMEYSFNAIEMALMKVHGYSLFERNIRLLQGTCISGTVGIVVAVFLNISLRLNARNVHLIGIGLIFICFEIICILFNANYIERHRIATILKGERI